MLVFGMVIVVKGEVCGGRGRGHGSTLFQGVSGVGGEGDGNNRVLFVLALNGRREEEQEVLEGGIFDFLPE